MMRVTRVGIVRLYNPIVSILWQLLMKRFHKELTAFFISLSKPIRQLNLPIRTLTSGA